MSNITSESELTTKEIVEQAISDYHESILPYLNGMVPTIANKFDKANLYSEDEQIIGRWIDGKPLYQKVVRNLNINIPYNSFVNSGIEASNVGQCVGCKGFDENGSFLGEVLCTTYGTGQRYTTWALQTVRNGAPIEPSTLVLKYTKTTDEAIAIGSDTDYSTTEKIVGTWIDGKPLYQKTITFTSPLPYDRWTDIGVSISGIDKLIDVSNMQWSYDTSSKQIIPVFASYNNNEVSILNVRNNNYASANNLMTVWYTKTTDV